MPQKLDIINIGIKANTILANIGAFVIIFSFISMFAYFSWQALFIFSLSLLMVLLPHKIQLDYSNQTYKIYQDFFIIRAGKNLPFSNLLAVHLRKSATSGLLQSTYRISPYSTSSFDVVLAVKNAESILVGEFKDHHGALNEALSLSQKLKIDFIDEVENALKNSKEKRRSGNLNYSAGIRQKRR